VDVLDMLFLTPGEDPARTDGSAAVAAVLLVHGLPGYPQSKRDELPGRTRVPGASDGDRLDPVELPMQDMWIRNVRLTMGLVDTVSIPTLLKMVASGRIPAEKMGTHSFTFDQMDEAYTVFGNAAAHSALKVIIKP